MKFLPMTPISNDHLVELRNHFGELTGNGATDIRRDVQHVFVCYTNRCGSNFVATSIGSSGFLNIAGEFFNADTVLEHCRSQGLRSVADFVNWLIDREGKNGYLVSKVAISHLEVLAITGILDQILDISAFIMIERSDKLGQAISYDIARQTGKWRSDMVSEMKDSDLKFSRNRLIDIIDAIASQNREFSRFFGLNGIVPASINYEQFEEDPAYYVGYLSRFLGISKMSFVPDRVEIQKQAGRINGMWRDRYKRAGISVT